MKLIFLLCLILVTFFSCKKKDADKMTISGQIRDPFQNIAVQGVTVDLFVKKIESGVYSSGYSLIQSSNTGNSGDFSFSFDAVIASSYKLSLRKAGYFNSEQEINPNKVTKGNNYNQQYSFYSEAFLKLHIINNTPSSSSDQITFRITKGYLNAYECCWDSFYTYVGKNVDVYQKCKIYGSQKLVFEWSVKNINSTIFHCDSLFCNSFDTAFYDITY